MSESQPGPALISVPLPERAGSALVVFASETSASAPSDIAAAERPPARSVAVPVPDLATPVPGASEASTVAGPVTLRVPAGVATVPFERVSAAVAASRPTVSVRPPRSTEAGVAEGLRIRAAAGPVERVRAGPVPPSVNVMTAPGYAARSPGPSAGSETDGTVASTVTPSAVL